MRACVLLVISSAGGDAPSTPIVLRWNGRSWAAQPGALLQGATAGQPLTDRQPDGVSCAAPKLCTIVGTVGGNGTRVTAFAERLARGRWSPLQPPADPTPVRPLGIIQGYELSSVSCTRATCVSVGDYVDATGKEQTLAEQFR
jgi:hypothetical protein